MKKRVLVLALAALMVLPFASRIVAWDSTGRDDVAAMQAELKKLRLERVDAAQQNKKSCESAWYSGTIVIETYLDAIDSLTAARLAVADSKESRIRAVEESVLTLRKIELHLRNHEETQQYARDHVNLRLKTAEIALIEAKLKAAGVDKP